jgi:hypothetical protein
MAARKITGRATIEGTKSFIQTSGLQLFHQFAVSGLTVTPVIHGPPLYIGNSPSSQLLIKTSGPLYHADKANKYLKDAIFKNKSNCVYVYNHYHNTNGRSLVWHATDLSSIISSSTSTSTSSSTSASSSSNNGGSGSTTVSRESVVTIAGLGPIAPKEEMLRRFSEVMFVRYL